MTATEELAWHGVGDDIGDQVGDDDAARLWAVIDQGFLVALRWDPEYRVLFFPEDHPVLGWTSCRVLGCRKQIRSSNGLCSTCDLRWKQTGSAPLAEFSMQAKPNQRSIGYSVCVVSGCQRPCLSSRKPLCAAHDRQRDAMRLPLEEFLARPDVVGHPSFGLCTVAACPRDRTSQASHCPDHQRVARERVRNDPVFDLHRWRLTAPAIAEDNQVSLRGLPVRAVAEILYGLQERVRAGVKTRHWHVRPYCDLVRVSQAASLAEMPPDLVRAASKATRQLHSAFLKTVLRQGRSPETERHKEEWDAWVFGHAGTVRFTHISQPWLREATKRWAFDDLPQRRGDSATVAVQTRVNAIARLSESLRLQRADNGDNPALLGRPDITAFCNRLAYLQQRGDLSGYARANTTRHVRHVLTRMRTLSLTRPNEPLHGIPEDFALAQSDIPDEPDADEAGKDLPDEVMRQLCTHLPQLENTTSQEIRVAVELMIDTGRRPDEVCTLDLDCLDRDGDGKPVLIYDNHKAHREARRLPIPETTAATIVEQRDRVRTRFPSTPLAELKLLPTNTKNPDGRKGLNNSWLSHLHRRWVNDLPAACVPTVVEVDGTPVTKMLPFDKAKIFPYAYRHTYAQRHADAGVDVTVLKDLMNHRLLSTTQSYYRLGEERRREAVERVTTMQFDRRGNRVWRQAKTLLDSEHARRAVGEVAVPYGGCSEPSNVAAGGQDCPLRFRCVGCGHFSTDISYLPDLERYLADLLRHRERLAATLDADEWAKSEVMPSDNEITRVRRLIDRMKGDLNNLSEEERAQIDEAVAVVRRGRAKVVALGIPRVRQPLPDIRPERSA